MSTEEHPVLKRCREETRDHPFWSMQIGAEQGSFFRVLLAIVDARKTLEIGVFTGYSSTLTALALPSDGKLVACDSSKEFTVWARRYWKDAGVERKIELRLGPAADTLQSLIDAGQAGTFDFAFIDADKISYDIYYERSLALLRPGGLIVLDNTLRAGRILESASTDPEVIALRTLNKKLAGDDRVLVSLVPLTDGTTLAWKKK